MRTRHQLPVVAATVIILSIAAAAWLVVPSVGSAATLSESAAQRAEAVSGATPQLNPPSAMTVGINETADQTVNATDADGDPLTFTKSFGPTYMTVSTTNPGTGSATGNIHLAPGTADAGMTSGGVAVSDGSHTNQGSFSIHVTAPNDAPVLQTPNVMDVDAGQVGDQALHATDANGDPLEFYLDSGPPWVTVGTEDAGFGTALGYVHVAPPGTLSDAFQAWIGVTDGQATDRKPLLIAVHKVELPPQLTLIPDQDLRVGEVRDTPLLATDPNGDPLTFAKESGPAYMSVATTDPGQGTAYGAMHLAPTGANVGSAVGRVSVTDGLTKMEQSFALSVRTNNSPSLNFIYDMSVRAGQTSYQNVYAYDPDGDPVTLGSVDGPPYMRFTMYLPVSQYASGEIRLSPLATDVGSATGTISATDGVLSVQQLFHITVIPPNRPPVLSPLSNVSVIVGEQAEQPISATDADGDYIYFYKASGPNYVSVSGSGYYGSATGTVRVSPGAGDVGSAVASIGVTDYTQSVTTSFTITVLQGSFPPGCPANTFSNRNINFGYGTIEVQTADLNDDGILDLVAEVTEAGRVKVALGIGGGDFGPPVDLISSSYPVSGVISDLNRDDIPDITIVNGSSNSVSVFLGDGTGAFGGRRDVPAGDGPRSITAADVNRDGKMDLLVANVGSFTGSVSILRGVGDGTFATPTTINTGAAAWAIVAPDLNGDGAPDVVVTSPDSSKVSVFLNNGFGTFGPRAQYVGGDLAYGMATGDLNGDGKVDLAVTSIASSSVSVLLGRGDGTFNPRRVFSTHYGPRQVAVVDMNGDGFNDVAAVNLDSYDVSILLGDGSGTLGPRTDIPVQAGPYGIATGDFNDDLRNDLAIANYYAGSVTLLLNENCAPLRDHPPVVKAPKSRTVGEGTLVTFAITASDPDGPSVTNLTASFAALPLGNNASFTADPGFTGGTFSWTPTYQDSRPTPYPVTFTATNVLAGTTMTKITVTNVNRAPIANAGGPYTAFTGAPLTFDGSASSDPDGETLTYLWFFGDGATGMGVKPVHSYAATGIYGVAVSVTDGALASLSTTTATIVGVFQARAFTASGNRSIRLSSGKPQWSVQLEPIGRAYSNVTVDMTSLVMKSAGTGSVSQIPAIASKTSAGGDRDGNGVEEIEVSFSKENLRLLFSNLHGTGSATVTIEGTLYTGGVIRASLDVGIQAGGGNLAASVNPNPLNPAAVLTFFTSKSGPVRIRAFDPQGRLVRTMLDEPRLANGYHDVAVDGRDDRGTPLASGVYYYRLEAAEGVTSGRFTVLR